MRGFPLLCGIDSARVREISADWERVSLPSAIKAKEILSTRGIRPIIPISRSSNRAGYFTLIAWKMMAPGAVYAWF